jgi:hypothetical protein
MGPGQGGSQAPSGRVRHALSKVAEVSKRAWTQRQSLGLSVQIRPPEKEGVPCFRGGSARPIVAALCVPCPDPGTFNFLYTRVRTFLS